jgi:hypothetical protein
MSLTEVITQFENTPPGTDAFKELNAACLNLIKVDPNHAGLYYPFIVFTRSYVILHEEEAVTFAAANKAKDQMLSYLKRIESALTSDSPEAFLSSLNWIVLDYLQSERVF